MRKLINPKSLTTIYLKVDEANSATSCRFLSYTSQIIGDVRTLCRKEKSNNNSSFIEAVIFLLHGVKHNRQFLGP